MRRFTSARSWKSSTARSQIGRCMQAHQEMIVPELHGIGLGGEDHRTAL